MSEVALPEELERKIANIYCFNGADGVRGLWMRTGKDAEGYKNPGLFTTTICVITMHNGDTFTGITKLQPGSVFDEKKASYKAKNKALRRVLEDYHKGRALQPA